VIDAGDATLGRVASQIANILRGKTKPSFTPNADCGDNVIVINASKLRVTGKKLDNKVYVTHSGYPGGQKQTTVRELKAKSPSKVVERAVRGMLPRTRLGREQFRNLFVYDGAEHPHEAQQPKQVKINL
jgi:large subunit ribosomal protein L13